MHRAILTACLPLFVWMLIAVSLIVLLLQICGRPWNWNRLRKLHQNQDGAVQSLSLVLTLPVFLLLLLFIVQISQLMVGVMMVNYAAYAAARAASVWIPAAVTTDPTFQDDRDAVDSNSTTQVILNEITGPSERANIVAGQTNPLDDMLDSCYSQERNIYLVSSNSSDSLKLNKVRHAAMIACLPISPSRDVGLSGSLRPDAQAVYDSLVKLYRSIDPRSVNNLQMPRRILNKVAYSSTFTMVALEWQEIPHDRGADVDDGPTYNPRNHPLTPILVPNWNMNEAGFRDPVTVRVVHRFALLPGMSNPLISYILAPTFGTDCVSRKMNQFLATQPTRTSWGRLGTVDISASATFVNEGYKSVLRYAVHP